MKRNRVRRFLQQRQYTIASFVLFAAIAAMTGVYMSNKVTDSNEDMEIAQKQKELLEQEDFTQGNELNTDQDHLPDSGEEDVTSVTSVIQPKDTDQDTDTGADQKSDTDQKNDTDTETGTKTDTDDTDTISNTGNTNHTDASDSENHTSNASDQSTAKDQQVSEESDSTGQQPSATEQKDTATQAKPAETINLHFSPKSDLGWPMQGDVIMNFSMDQTVYFATLEQYKYNPALIIAGKVNDPVSAAATGRITDISTNEETGMTVTMDLGDGYTAIYGQLKEVLYKEGAVVEAGNAIGYIAEPTKYYSVEGSNLYFALQKDEKPINPMQYIQ